LKYRPPTIAVVYKLDPMSRTLSNKKTSKRLDKKYIHEIQVKNMTIRMNLNDLCDKLCEQESYYLNP